MGSKKQAEALGTIYRRLQEVALDSQETGQKPSIGTAVLILGELLDLLEA